jgi:hypothetical protein
MEMLSKKAQIGHIAGNFLSWQLVLEHLVIIITFIP